jgi:hypothetical protein
LPGVLLLPHIDDLKVVPPARSNTSCAESVSFAVSGSLVSKKTSLPSSELPPKKAGNAPLPPAGPVETSVVVPLARSYMSVCESVSAATSLSLVWKNTRVPSREAPSKNAPRPPLPPAGPVERRVVVPFARSYTSFWPSVSPGSSRSVVPKKTRLPSADAPAKNALNAPLPPAEPVETSVVTPPARSYTSVRPSVSVATSDSTVWKNTRVPSSLAPA